MFPYHYGRFCYSFLADKGHIFFEIITEGGHKHVLFRSFYAPCVYPFHAHKIKQRAQHRFHRPAPYFTHPFGIFRVCLQFFVHFIKQFLVYAVVYLFELRPYAAARFPQGASGTVLLTAAVGPFYVSLAVRAFAFI